ncbi:permease, partial [Vibrio vulnificus]
MVEEEAKMPETSVLLAVFLIFLGSFVQTAIGF